MTSICNYSHPESQITEGLVPHKTGSLFPYNPAFYELASGLYGPGSIYSWHLILTSVIINWTFHHKDRHGHTRPGISTDLLAVVAYPVFAATDALVQAVRFLGTEYRALAIFCLRFPKTDLTGFGDFNVTQLDLRNIPPDILSVGQHVIEITGPPSVCYTFTALLSVLIMSLLVTDVANIIPWRPTRAAKQLLYGGYGYVMLVLAIFHLSLGDLGISFFIGIYEAILPFEFVLMFGASIFVLFGLVGTVVLFIISLSKMDTRGVWDALRSFASILLVGAFCPGVMIPLVYLYDLRLIPDLGVTVDARDQLAALIVGIVTLGFTLYGVWRAWKLPQASPEMDPEEMRTLV